MTPPALRFADDADDILEGIGIPFDGPFQGKDLHKTRFSDTTDYALDWFPVRPLLYNHGLDADAGISVVGTVRAWEIRADVGLWVQAQLDRSTEYFAGIRDLVKAGKLYLSSGAMGHLVDEDTRTGEIRRWPWVELSLTPTPSNLYATVDFATATKHYRSAGIDLSPDVLERLADDDQDDATRATLDAKGRDNLGNSAFAYIDKEGGRHLPIHDAAHARNALARFNQTHFESAEAKATAHAKILAACKRFGIDVSDHDADDPQRSAPLRPLFDAALERLGAGESLDSVLDDLRLLAEGGDDAGPLALDYRAIHTRLEAALQRTQDLHDRRIREGRVLSSTNRRLLEETATALESATRAIRDLLDRTAQMATEQARAALLARPDERRRQIALNELFLATL